MARFFTLLVAAAGLLVQNSSALPAPLVPYPAPNGTVTVPFPTGTAVPVPFPTGGYPVHLPPVGGRKERSLRTPNLNFPRPY